MCDDAGEPPFTLPPDPGALLAALAGMLRGGDLGIIAEADYGSDAAEHLAALRRIADDGEMPCPLPWHPLEVLSLVRWDQPPPEPAEERRLWRHAFACCALLRAYGDPESCEQMFEQDPTLVGLATSLHHLALLPLPRAKRAALATMDRQATALLAWLAPRVADHGEAAFFGLALLWFALASPVPDAAIEALVDWILRAEALLADPVGRLSGDHRREAWLFGTTFGNLRQDAWRTLGRRLPERLRSSHGTEVAKRVREISGLLAP